MGAGERKEIEFHANKLREFILHVRESVLKPGEKKANFRVYLVAHSMGGLVCRCYLQNKSIRDLNGKPDTDWTKKGVDKFFTFATPHGGIEFRKGLGWTEGLRDFMDINNQANFGEKRMRDYLGIKNKKISIKDLNGRYPAERVFSLVGTDSRDYGAAGGLSRRSVGPLSDGLVQIENASVLGSSRAFIHRSHSGHYGIVNSEAGYQNLRRFLFGKIRAHVEMIVDQINLPPRLASKVKSGKIKDNKIEAPFYVETVFAMRGLPVELNRRTFDEESAIRRPYNKFKKSTTQLFTAFLLHSAQNDMAHPSLGYSLRIQVRVPEYKVDGFIFSDKYEGGLLFSDKLNIEIKYDKKYLNKIKDFQNVLEAKSISYGWDREGPNETGGSVEFSKKGGSLIGEIPFKQDTTQGIIGRIRITLNPWNKQ